MVSINELKKECKVPEENAVTPSTSTLDDATILPSVPTTFKRILKQLLQFLKKSSLKERIGWDLMGAVTINGELI